MHVQNFQAVTDKAPGICCSLDPNQHSVLRYTIGKVIGAGSFGVVREAVHKRTNLHYACKTIPKLPKKGRGTPRYLLKIQTEVDAMLQLGPSLDAVFLQVLFINIRCHSKIVPSLVAFMLIFHKGLCVAMLSNLQPGSCFVVALLGLHT